MAWTLTTLSGALYKAGANASLGCSGAMLEKFSDQAEGSINAITRRDWVALSGSTAANFRGILDDTASDMIAMKIINFDMSGFTSRQEAQTMLDVLRDNITRNLDALKDEKNKEKML